MTLEHKEMFQDGKGDNNMRDSVWSRLYSVPPVHCLSLSPWWETIQKANNLG